MSKEKKSNIFSCCCWFKRNHTDNNFDKYLHYTIQAGETIQTVSSKLCMTEEDVIKLAGDGITKRFFVEPSGERKEFNVIIPGTVLNIEIDS